MAIKFPFRSYIYDHEIPVSQCMQNNLFLHPNFSVYRNYFDSENQYTRPDKCTSRETNPGVDEIYISSFPDIMSDHGSTLVLFRSTRVSFSFPSVNNRAMLLSFNPFISSCSVQTDSEANSCSPKTSPLKLIFDHPPMENCASNF